jgi:hypothetical protein
MAKQSWDKFLKRETFYDVRFIDDRGYEDISILHILFRNLESV